MPTLREVANQYDAHATRLARRHEGKLTPVLIETIQTYRQNADAVRAMITPEVPQEAVWNLENEAQTAVKFTK